MGPGNLSTTIISSIEKIYNTINKHTLLNTRSCYIRVRLAPDKPPTMAEYDIIEAKGQVIRIDSGETWENRLSNCSDRTEMTSICDSDSGVSE